MESTDIAANLKTLNMAGLLGVSQYNLTARAVALGASGGHCMLVTDPAGVSRWGGPAVGLGLWGGVTVTMTRCGIAVNSSGSGALTLQSGSTLNAPLVSLVEQLNNVWSTVKVASLKQNQQPVVDPCANAAAGLLLLRQRSNCRCRSRSWLGC
jgi:hypothetical protein